MSKKTLRQQKHLKDKIQKEIRRRFYHRNLEAMSFCNSHGLTIYVASQASNSSMVKIFVQKGVPFRPLTEKLFDQSNPDDVMEYIARIDKEYERLYLKMKNKV